MQNAITIGEIQLGLIQCKMNKIARIDGIPVELLNNSLIRKLLTVSSPGQRQLFIHCLAKQYPNKKDKKFDLDMNYIERYTASLVRPLLYLSLRIWVGPEPSAILKLKGWVFAQKQAVCRLDWLLRVSCSSSRRGLSQTQNLKQKSFEYADTTGEHELGFRIEQPTLDGIG